MKKLWLMMVFLVGVSLTAVANEAEIKTLYDSAWQFVEKDNINQAVAQWKKILELDPTHFEARYFLSIREDGVGYGFMQDKPYWDALAEEFPDNLLVQYQKTRYNDHNRIGDKNSIIASYKAILAVDPNHFLTNYSLGVYLNTLMFDSEAAEAEVYIKKALEIHPKSVQATYALGVIQWENNLNKEAEATFKKALTFMPLYEKVYYNAEIWNSLAQLYAMQGRNKDIEVLRNNPANQKYGNQGFTSYTQNIINTGKAFAKAGNKVGAADMFLTVIKTVDRSGYIIDDARLKAERELLALYQ